MGPEFEFVDEWTLPLLPESGDGAPTQFVDACFAVGSDLRWRRYGAFLNLDRLQWTLSLLETGGIQLGLTSSGSRPRIKWSGDDERTIGMAMLTIDLHIDRSLAEVTVSIADIVQTELAGYPPWIQWPIEEKRLLLPKVSGGEAVWQDPRTGRRVATIGLLAG